MVIQVYALTSNTEEAEVEQFYEGKRRRGRYRMGWLDNITSSMHMSLSKLWEIVKDRMRWLVGISD